MVFGNISEADSIELMHYAYDLGINLFDSAPIYGFGMSEQRIGKAFKGAKRDSVYITSKSGVTWHDTKRVNMTNDPFVAEKMILQSLRDLQTDYIDLYFIHWPDKNIDIRKPLEVLEKYREKKVIRAVGLCNTTIEDLTKAKEVTDVSVVQSQYHIFDRAVESEILPSCEQNGCAFMSWGTLDKGILGGNYNLNRVFDDTDYRKKSPTWKKSDAEKKVEKVEEMKKILPAGITMVEVAVAFNLKNSALTTILSGPKNRVQLDSLVRAIGRADEVIKKVDWKRIELLSSWC
jgi:myo-inositol catabolism protein IolS